MYNNEIKDELADLGLGKLTRFYYPWNPKGSPDMCQLANDDVNGLGKH